MLSVAYECCTFFSVSIANLYDVRNYKFDCLLLKIESLTANNLITTIIVVTHHYCYTMSTKIPLLWCHYELIIALH